MRHPILVMIGLFALAVCLPYSTVSAQSPTATLNLVNNTDATLHVEIQSAKHFDEFAEIVLQPVTERAITVPAGIVILRARTILGKPVKDFSRNLTLNNGSRRELNIFPTDFGSTFLADPPSIEPSIGLANNEPAANVESSNFLGCYKDQGDPTGTEGRDLNGAAFDLDNMTPGQCVSSCGSRGFQYAGTQYGRWCFCGNSYGNSGSASNCNMPCSGDDNQTCGGSWANSVYKTR